MSSLVLLSSLATQACSVEGDTTDKRRAPAARDTDAMPAAAVLANPTPVDATRADAAQTAPVTPAKDPRAARATDSPDQTELGASPDAPAVDPQPEDLGSSAAAAPVIVESREAQQLRIVAQHRPTIVEVFTAYLGRAPAEQEVIDWAWAIHGKLDRAAFERAVASSVEALQLRLVNQHRPTINHIFVVRLGRMPGEQEVINWSWTIYQQGLNATQVDLAVMSSDEYLRRFVASYYQQLLYRGAGEAEIQHWLPYARAYGLAFVEQQIRGSDEHWVIWAYLTYAGRLPAPVEIHQNIYAIAVHGRQAVLNGIVAACSRGPC